MSSMRWRIDVEDADDLTPAAWHRVTQGRSRLRAAAVFLICTLARPDDVHRLYWLSKDDGTTP